MKRRMISLTVAMLLILAMPLQAMAATHEVSDFQGVSDAFMTDTDAEVVVNLTNDIEWVGGVTANEGQNYTVNGNGNDISGYVQILGQGELAMNTDIVDGGIAIFGGADVAVDGNISGDGGVYTEGGSLTVSGDITVNGTDGSGYIQVYDGSLTVDGSVTTSSGMDIGDAVVSVGDDVSAESVNVYNAELSVDGDVAVSESIWAQESSTVEITGSLDAVQVGATSGSDMSVEGDVAASDVYVDNGSLAVGGDIVDSSSVSVYEGDVSVEGDVAASDVYVDNGSLTVGGDVNATESIYTDNSAVKIAGNVETDSVSASNSELTVGGDVNASEEGIYMDNVTVTIAGDVETLDFHTNSSTIVIEGNISAEEIGLSVVEGTAEVGGSITSEHSNALQAIGGSTVTVGGNAVGGSDVFTYEDETIASGGVGVVADDSNVTVKGNVIGGGADAVTNMSQGGMGIAAMGSATVQVGGNVTGGDATQGIGYGGYGVYYDEYEKPFTGSVTVGGTISGGKGTPDGMDGWVDNLTPPEEEVAPPTGGAVAQAPEEEAPTLAFSTAEGETDVAVTVAVADHEIIIEQMKEEEIETLLESLKQSVKEDADSVTIDVSAHKDVSALRIPEAVLKAIIEAFGKLEIVFNGGTLIIDAAEFEKLVAELGYVTINLK